MNKIIYRLITIIFLIISLISCKQLPTPEQQSSFKLNKITPQDAYTGDIITLYGTGFGERRQESRILIDTFAVINSEDCLRWNNSMIKFYFPNLTGNFKIRVVAGNDTSKTQILRIKSLPQPDMADIPSGTFSLGSASGFDNEKPVHNVNITHAFSIGKYEVNIRLWNNIMKDSLDLNPDDIDMPVSGISWKETIFFCNNLSKRFNLDTCYTINGDSVFYNINSKGYRLPTEAEWEYACRSGSNDDILDINKMLEYGWCNSNSGYKAHPSATKLANNWGIFDMQGNVWEWCWDWYSANYYSQNVTTDPLGPGSGSRHVMRGGSWMDGVVYMRPSNRSVSETSVNNTGLRIVKSK